MKNKNSMTALRTRSTGWTKGAPETGVCEGHNEQVWTHFTPFFIGACGDV